MFGLSDPMIIIAWLGTIISALGCVVFGIFTWNKGDS
ncbi:symporter small accessory protein [Virgibacillus necropolis]